MRSRQTCLSRPRRGGLSLRGWTRSTGSSGKALKKRVQILYSVHSTLPHGGRKAAPEEDVAELTTAGPVVVMRLIAREDDLVDRAALLEWNPAQKPAPAGRPG